MPRQAGKHVRVDHCTPTLNTVSGGSLNPTSCQVGTPVAAGAALGMSSAGGGMAAGGSGAGAGGSPTRSTSLVNDCVAVRGVQCGELGGTGVTSMTMMMINKK